MFALEIITKNLDSFAQKKNPSCIKAFKKIIIKIIIEQKKMANCRFY